MLQARSDLFAYFRQYVQAASSSNFPGDRTAVYDLEKLLTHCCSVCEGPPEGGGQQGIYGDGLWVRGSRGPSEKLGREEKLDQVLTEFVEGIAYRTWRAESQWRGCVTVFSESGAAIPGRRGRPPEVYWIGIARDEAIALAPYAQRAAMFRRRFEPRIGPPRERWHRGVTGEGRIEPGRVREAWEWVLCGANPESLTIPHEARTNVVLIARSQFLDHNRDEALVLWHWPKGVTRSERRLDLSAAATLATNRGLPAFLVCTDEDRDVVEREIEEVRRGAAWPPKVRCHILDSQSLCEQAARFPWVWSRLLDPREWPAFRIFGPGERERRERWLNTTRGDVVSHEWPASHALYAGDWITIAGPPDSGRADLVCKLLHSYYDNCVVLDLEPSLYEASDVQAVLRLVREVHEFQRRDVVVVVKNLHYQLPRERGQTWLRFFYERWRHHGAYTPTVIMTYKVESEEDEARVREAYREPLQRATARARVRRSGGGLEALEVTFVANRAALLAFTGPRGRTS